MRRHTTIGARAARGLAVAAAADRREHRAHPPRALGRHRLPAGLRGEEIPLAGRIAAICDVFDALTTERPYKAAWTRRGGARGDRRGSAARHFDPDLARTFVALVSRRPTGFRRVGACGLGQASGRLFSRPARVSMHGLVTKSIRLIAPVLAVIDLRADRGRPRRTAPRS